MWLLNPYRFGDPDAAAYIAAVEAADGQVLEGGVASAITSFVVGCKADGIWGAIKASCIMAGARTLTGALVPLRGAAPTNFNFVAGDYDRKTGLKGNGSNKYLDSNRANNADPQNNSHLASYATTLPSSGQYHWHLFGGTGGGTKILVVDNRPGYIGLQAGITNFSWPADIRGTIATGFVGASRSLSTEVNGRTNQATFTVLRGSVVPSSGSIRVFSAPGDFSNARLSFYSIGEAIDLALLDARVTTLMNALAAAIP